MPQAKRSTTTRVTSKFREPAALKRLTTSLDTAQKALAELSKGSGRATGKAGKDIYTDMRKFVSDARKEGGKLGKALQREFDRAQKELTKAAKPSSRTRSTSSRSTAKRSTTARSASSRSTASRSTASRASGGRSTTRRASSASASTKRGSTSSKRGTSKS